MFLAKMRMKNWKRFIAIFIACMMLMSLVACGKQDEPDTTTLTTTNEPDETVPTTTEPDETDTTTTVTETDPTSKVPDETTEPVEDTPIEDDPVVNPPAEGLIVFYEDFNSYANNTDTAAVLEAIGWTRLTKEANGVYKETDSEFSIVDGRLYYDNYKTDDEKAALTAAGDTRVFGEDGYYGINMLNDEYMRPVSAGKYTLQYDLEYIDSASNSRYAVIITELSSDGQCYNSFHFRIGGYGNNQCHFYGAWKTHDAFDAAVDCYAATQAASEEEAATKGNPISFKLLGKYNDKTNEPRMFANIPVTIKVQWDPEAGPHTYMKTATMTEFVKISEPSVNADGGMYIGWEGWAVALKIGAAIDGYIDNICIWTGWDEKPVGTTVTYQPATK